MKSIHLALFIIKKTLKNPGLFWGGIVMVMFTMFFMGVLFDGNQQTTIRMEVLNYDGSAVSSQYIKALENGSIDIKTVSSSQDVENDIKNGRIDAGIVLYKDFYKPAESQKSRNVKVDVILPKNSDYNKVIADAVRQSVAQMQADSYLAGLQSSASSKIQAGAGKFSGNAANNYKINISYYQNKKPLSSSAAVHFGYVIVFIMTMQVYAVGAIFTEKKEKTWDRLISTPLSSMQLMMGYFLGVLIQGYIQLALLVVSTKLLFNTQWGSSYPILFAQLSLLLFVSIGIGILLLSFSKSYAQFDLLCPMIIIGTSLLSGCLVPLNIMSPFMRKIAVVTPQYWVLTGLQNIGQNTIDSSNLLSIIILSAITAACMLISLARMKLWQNAR